MAQTTGSEVSTFDYMSISGARSAFSYFRMFDELREAAPVYRGDTGTGADFWLITRGDAVRRILQQPDLFSNSATVVTEPEPDYNWIPQMLDPPAHTTWRYLLSPFFSPSAVQRLEPRIREHAATLVERVADDGRTDLVTAFARPLPSLIFLDMLDLPVEDAGQLADWDRAIAHTDPHLDPTGESALRAMGEVTQYFTDVVAKRRLAPGEDLLSAAMSWKIDGESVSDEDLQGFLLLLMLAALGTVTSQLSYAYLHLATHEDDRHRVASDPHSIPGAVEEFVRAHAIIFSGRKVTRDTELLGCPVKRGDMVYLPMCAPARDDREVPDAGEIQLDRGVHRQLGFGAGPHRCLGSHLARAQMRIAFEEWHRRIPDYQVAPGVQVMEHGRIAMTIDSLPLVWSTTER